jgi:uncharacterized damage-inducible protein DinB
MAGNAASLTETYKGWDVYQGHLLFMVTPLTPDQLSLRSAPHLRSVGEIAAHIVGARARWITREFEATDPVLVELSKYGRGDIQMPVPSVPDLVSGLQATWKWLAGALSTWTTDDLAQVVFDGERWGEHVTFTRQWVLWHLIEHDMHHGGELSLTLGMYNLATPDV